VRITESRETIVFVVEDDGHGFDPRSVTLGCDGFGFGLSSMSERARLIGGTLEIDSAPACGTRLRVEIPAALVQRYSAVEIASSRGGSRDT
jgi:signal transduction histidine kinase